MVVIIKGFNEQETAINVIRGMDGIDHKRDTIECECRDLVDYNGVPADKATTGGWRCTPLIFAAEFAERVANLGISANLVTFLVFHKHFQSPVAANMTTNFLGTSYLSALLGGTLSDAWLGRFNTIVNSGLVVLLGLGVLVLSTTLNSLKSDPKCDKSSSACPPPHGLNPAVLFIGLYLVAVGNGCMKSCVAAFGADQFDEKDPKEHKQSTHYFGCFYIFVVMGAVLGCTLTVWIGGTQGWNWACGALGVVMGLALILIMSGRTLYRYKIPSGNPFTTMARVGVAALKNRRLSRPSASNFSHWHHDHCATSVRELTDDFRFLDKAAIVADEYNSKTMMPQQDQRIMRLDRTRSRSTFVVSRWRLVTVSDVEDVKLVLRLLPFLASIAIFWTVQAQLHTWSILQVRTVNRHIFTSSVAIPSGSVAAFSYLTALATVVLYDGLLLPVARKLKVGGITPLQRIGIGMFLSIFSMIAAGLQEFQRLKVARSGNVRSWTFYHLLPSYIIMGVAEALVYPGMLEFFYTGSPLTMQSLGSALAVATVALGFFGSSLLVSLVNKFSEGRDRKKGWLPNDLNDGHLDYFFWMLATLLALNLPLYVLTAHFHNSRKRKSTRPVGKNGAATTAQVEAWPQFTIRDREHTVGVLCSTDETIDHE